MTTASTEAGPAKSHEFKAEIRQLLEILVHSVYQAKDVFLRELISNSADALEKVRFAQVRGQAIADPETPLEIRIEVSKENDQPKLVITDTGVGMTEEEVHRNIGTIAHSGAASFLEKLKQESGGAKPDLSLIGRFGIGFYSVFMAADKVVLTTRSAQPGSPTVVWTSDGLGSYSTAIAPDNGPRGTKIEIHLKKEEGRFAEDYTLKTAIRRYSNFIPFPIFVGADQVNRTSALWREQPSQVKDEQYKEFFKFVCHEEDDPLLRAHLSADAPIQYSALLFVPPSNPESMGFGRGEVSVQLYVKRVLIDSENKHLLPGYLRFVKGVVESDDLPLNISRETLQENRVMAKIRDLLSKRILDALLELAEEKPEEYRKFWDAFGAIVKEGYQDFGNRERIQKLLRFNSSRHTDDAGRIGLGEYVTAMPTSQNAIYFLSGPSRESLSRDSRLEMFRKRKIEVLYLTDLADEFVLGNLGDFLGKKLISADQVQPGDLKGVGEEPAEEPTSADASDRDDVQPLLARCKEILGDQVLEVRASARLVDSPACLVGDDQQPSGHVEKLMRRLNKNSEAPARIFELNPKHPLVRNLAGLVKANPQDAFVERALRQLFEGTLLVDGYLTDPHLLVERMVATLSDAAQAKSGK